MEGFFDGMKVHQAGFVSVVALMGATLSAYQEQLLCARFAGVILLLDGDPAGRRGAAAITAQLTNKCRVEVLALPDGVQPDQLSSDEIARLLGPKMEPDRDQTEPQKGEFPSVNEP